MSAHKDKIDMVNRGLKEALSELNSIEVPSSKGKVSLFDAADHVLEGGKRLRPLMCMLACEAVGGDPSKVLPTAVGIELIHTFTLVHDDIMDKSSERRGKPSIHVLWGEPVAILTGDALFTLGLKKISSNFEVDGIDADRVKRVLNLATDACLRLAQGQMMDISLAADPSECGRDEIIRLKTASLFSFASESGATLEGGSQKEIECMKKYGLQVGMAFQIKDDILDIVGNAKTIGKPNGNDLKNGKSTLPVLHAIKNGGIKKGEGALGSRDNPTRLSELLKQRGSIDYAERIARKIINDAKDNLQMVRDWSVRRFLVTLADYAIGWG